jgi:hypothetical protein
MKTTVVDVLTGAGAVFMAVALLAMALHVSMGQDPSDPLIALMALGMVGAVTGLVQRYDRGLAQQPTPHEALLQARRWRAGRVDSDHLVAMSAEQV